MFGFGATVRRRLSLSWLPLPRGRKSRFAFEVLLIAPAYLAYHVVRGAVDGRAEEAFANARHVMQVQESLGIFWELQLQSMALSHDLLISFFNHVYIWGHIPFIFLTALWLFSFRSHVFARYRNAFLISGGIGLIFFVTFPVAPPRFFPEVGFVDTVTLGTEAYRVLQPPELVNQFAAVPSLHFGWNLLVGIAIFETTRTWFARGIAVTMPLLMLAGIILTANHFIVDAAVGGAVALFALWIAYIMNRRLAGTRVHSILV